MRKGSERKKGKSCNGFMQSYKHMSGVFGLSRGHFFGENKHKSGKWEEEELIYLNPVWVSSRPWTS